MHTQVRHTINTSLTLTKGLLGLGVTVFLLVLGARIGFAIPSAISPADVNAMPAETPVYTATPEPSPAPAEHKTDGAITRVIDVPSPTATPEPTPTLVVPYLVAGSAGANVRRGPSTYYAITSYLEPGTYAAVTGRFNDWWQVDIQGESGWIYGGIVAAYHVNQVEIIKDIPSFELEYAPETILSPATPDQITELRWIDVDLSEQTVRAYENGVVVQTYLVSTGLPVTPTPTGQFRIWIKLQTDDMAGADYYIEDVPWVMYFYQGYGLHGVTWHANFGQRMSHGCVNQPNDMAEWLFNFAEVGTLVNIHE